MSERRESASVLLTSEAVEAAAAAQDRWSDSGMLRWALEPFVSHHATEGREALVVAVRDAVIWRGLPRVQGGETEADALVRYAREVAEAVVVALVGGDHE